MLRGAIYIIIILSISLSSSIYQNQVYQDWIPRLIWSVDTLHLNVIANRDGWRACKCFGWCDARDVTPAWPVLWRGEMRWRV